MAYFYADYKTWTAQCAAQNTLRYRPTALTQRSLSPEPNLLFDKSSSLFSLNPAPFPTILSLSSQLQTPLFSSAHDTRFFYGPAYLGTAFSQILSFCRGLHHPFFLRCTMKGVGYRVWRRETLLFFKLGFTHKVSFFLPAHIKVRTHKYRFLISSFSKQGLMQVARFLLLLRQPDAYKGKGIRYSNDQVFQKSRTKDSKKRLSFKYRRSYTMVRSHHSPLFKFFLNPQQFLQPRPHSLNTIDPYFKGERLFFHGLPLESDLSLTRALGKIHGVGRHRLSLLASFLGIGSHFPLSSLSRRKWLALEPFSRFFILDRGLKKYLKARTGFFVSSGHYRGLRQQQGLPSHGQRTRTNAKTSKVRQRPLILSDKEIRSLKKEQKALKKKKK